MSASEAFHQHGHHVQKAHGRRSVQLAADGSHLQGGMVALMPTVDDSKRLALKGGEAAADLHLTLYYLGPDVTVFDGPAREAVIAVARAVAAETLPITANIFGAAHWNAGGDSPSWVWSVGDAPGTDTDSEAGLNDLHEDVDDGLDDIFGDLDDVQFPGQHTPWVAHICAAYTDDLSLSKELEKRNGPVSFDRLRVSFGDQDTDIPLTGTQLEESPDEEGDGEKEPETVTAAGPFRRKPTASELAGHVDFAVIDAEWKHAVEDTVASWAAVTRDQRAQLRQQITAAVDSGNPDQLSTLDVDTEDAARLLEERMTRLAQLAGEEMQREAEAQGVTVPPWSLSGDAVTAGGSPSDKIRATARVTARALGLGLVQSASRNAVRLARNGQTGRSLASAVDRLLSKLSAASVRDSVRSAMSAAQGFGRSTVLAVAPTADYYATEMMDDRTCEPCRQIDGKVFSNLDDADSAYPAGCYVDCQGGGRCRGEIYALWDQGTAASAATKGGSMDQSMGGKPSKGTNKDGRLRKNAYVDGDCPDCPDDMDEHFGTQVVELAWDGAASRFDDAQYKRATAACDPGTGTVKERCFLPHHEPSGSLNKDGMHAAAQRVGSLKGHDPAAVARAKAHLRGHYSQSGETPPDSIKATLGDAVALAAGKPTCPEGMEPDPNTGDCVEMQSPGRGSKPGMKSGHPSGYAADTAMPVDGGDGKTAAWRGPLAIEGKVTGDGREFARGKLTWPDNPVPGEMALRWNKEDSHGGDPHTVAVNVGRIDRVWRDGDLIMGEGVFDLGHPDGAEAHRRVEQGFLRGISIDADSIGDADIEYVMAENDQADGDASPLDILFAAPEKVVFNGGRIRAATLCDIPAFVEAYIALVDTDGAVVAGGAPHPDLVPVRHARGRSLDGLVAHGGPEWKPPAAWFANPQLSVPTGIQVDDSGRVYGHAATWGTCHIGQSDVCIQPPEESQHSYFMTGEAVTAEGGRAPVGQITVGTGHAPLSYGAVPATEHYEHTGHAVADVSVGNDAHGIWVAGAIRPGADPLLVHELRASGQVSGDWRRIGSSLRLVGLLAVNVPGFPVPKTKARVASGAQQALVAAGRPTVAHAMPEEEKVREALTIVMNMLFARVHEGRD